MTRAIVLALTLCSSSTLQAQQSPLVGTWQVSYTAGMKIENGMQTLIMATGALTIAAAGDSLVATLVTDPSEEIPTRPPARMAATATTGDAVFHSKSKATINFNGQERETTSVNMWTLTARGDSLSGTVERSIEGFDGPAPEPRPVTGTRRMR
jgi:hypothetical protein